MTTDEDKVQELMGLVAQLRAYPRTADDGDAEGWLAGLESARSTLESALRAVVDDAMRWQEARKRFRVMSAYMESTIDRARKGDQSAGEPS